MRYCNPVYPYYFADPFVWKFEGQYYAVGTGPIHPIAHPRESDLGPAPSRHGLMAFPLLHSVNMVEWNLMGGALIVPEFARQGAFWAPEVACANGRFYMYYSCAVTGLEHQLRVAVSDSPLGPFIDQNPVLPPHDNCPFAIDAHPFQDDDGQWYLFYARDFLDHDHRHRAGTALVVDQLIDMTHTAGEQQTVLRARCDWQLFKAQRQMYGRTFDWHTLEGPSVRKHQGRYYCFYSGGCYEGAGYGVDYGVADHVMGPYYDEGNSDGARVLRTIPGKVIGPGHHSIVIGPDDITDFLVYHAWDPEMTARRMFIDPLAWENGIPVCKGPSWTPQQLPEPVVEQHDSA
ncbi:MAG: glycoside hydrolase family 43 protein [Verrucomicrobiota bacterium]|nr:glycoside hydrolase family 43 protein [Verrucomicrobiota bacterium]